MNTEKARRDMHVPNETTGLKADDIRTFDTMCIPTVTQYSPSQIKYIRKENHASQAVFAMCLNTSVSTIRQWEQGSKRPNGIAQKLLSLVQENGLGVLLAPGHIH